MANVSETIPEALQPEVDAALAWFNQAQGGEFEVTGILDADRSVAENEPRELRLVLCGGDTCQQRSFRLTKTAEGFDIAYADAEAPGPDGSTELQSELDPPPGPRRGWLDSVLGRHPFVVLLFYRGFW